MRTSTVKEGKSFHHDLHLTATGGKSFHHRAGRIAKGGNPSTINPSTGRTGECAWPYVRFCRGEILPLSPPIHHRRGEILPPTVSIYRVERGNPSTIPPDSPFAGGIFFHHSFSVSLWRGNPSTIGKASTRLNAQNSFHTHYTVM